MYKEKINKFETQKAVKNVERKFKEHFSQLMNLTEVNGPLFVDPKTGFNDSLSGTEHPVSFEYKNNSLEIVHSLAKWKRFALWEFGIPNYEGIFVEMDAIRPNENFLSKYHSLHVEQYDWEKVILKEDRNINFLFSEVNKIYKAILETKKDIKKLYPSLEKDMTKEVAFISSEELKTLYPDLTPEERERKFAEAKGSIFIYGIGHKLSDNQPHGLRAPDYDDWNLNGDLIVWDQINQDAIELSSMGIRVDAKSLQEQMNIINASKFTNFHNSIMENTIPLSIGGGIGLTRVNMILLEKAHIGEVQATYWPDDYRKEMLKKGITLLK